MTDVQHHIIAKQTLDVDMFATESEAWALQQALPQLLAGEVSIAIEKVLNRYSKLGEHIKLDYLEINLGELSLVGLEHDLAQQVEYCLERALREKISSLATSNMISSEYQNEALGMTVQTQQQSLFAAFIYFLSTGRLPWSFKLAENKSLEQMLLEAGQTFLPNQNIHVEIKALLNNESVCQRLIYQFSNTFLLRLLVVLLPNSELIIIKVYALLQQLQIATPDKMKLSRHFWLIVLRAVPSREVLTFETLLQAIAAQLITNDHFRSLSKHTIDLMTVVFNQYDIALKPFEPVTINTEVKSESTATANPKTLMEYSLAKSLEKMDEQSQEVNEAIYIDVAGLVLLHPFLPQFFKTLNIIVDDEIVQPARAVCLLHYLCTGQTNPAEHALVLAKIVCGIALSYPVAMDFEPTTEEVNQTESLLNAVISHWHVLQSTSIDGLRGTFLIRNGKLTLKQDSSWQLKVESKGFDILMDSLPWSISMIQLPWMRHMLFVEWTN
jgi:hypothetical protein